MLDTLKEAYQQQGVIRYLCDNKGFDYSEAYNLIGNYDVNTLRYRYNIPDNELNKFWYKALSC